MAVGLCRVIEGIGVGSVDQALIGEVIGPGLAGLFVIDLLVERRVGVDDVAHEVAVLVLHVAVGAFIEVVDHRGRQLVRADGGSRGVGSEEAARQHVEEHDDADDQNSADGDQRRLQALAHTFLCFVGSLRERRPLPCACSFRGMRSFGIIPLICHKSEFCRKPAAVSRSGNSMRIIPKTARHMQEEFFCRNDAKTALFAQKSAAAYAYKVSPQKPCGSNYNLHETGRWVASLLLLCFQRPPPVRAVGGRPAIDSKSIRHPLNIMWV